MKEILEILNLPIEEAMSMAMRIRQTNFPTEARKLSLVNGYLLGPVCGGDCRFCGWNRHIVPCEPRPKLDNATLQQVIRAAREETHQQTPWIELINNTIRINKLLLRELEDLSWACRESRVGVSIGLSNDRRHFEALKEMGYTYYVNDLETSPRIFPSFVTTHQWEEKLVSMQLCKEAGLSLHSGFIMGFEETDEDMVVVFKTLRDYQVEGIVVNFYTHVNGTPHTFCHMTPEDVLKRLAQLRIAFPSTSLILGGGRRRLEVLKDALLIVDTIYTRSFLNHPDPYWLKEAQG